MELTPAIKKLHRAWCMFDWANSSYNLIITSTIFPIYYVAITGDHDDSTIDTVSFFGWQVTNSALLAYAMSFAYLIVALISPILSSIADFRGTKRRFMAFFCYLGGIACCGLFFFKPGLIEFGILLAILAAIGYSGGVVFNNAYLPEIADEAYHDKLSAKGFSYGYVGSVLLQLICLGLIFGLGGDNPLGPRISFLLVGLWWMGFAQIPIRVLPKGTPIGNGSGHSIWTNGFHELKKVWDQITHTPLLKRFLLSFFFYSMGVQTIMLAAELFAAKEIKKEVDGVWVGLDTAELIIIILLIQLIAIVGANLMARLSAVIGNIKVLMLTVGLWIGICMAAYITYTAIPFYILAAVVGLVMGGIQSMSRSTFSKMMPETRDTASFFSFYNFVERIAIVIGLFSFGFIEEVTGSMRNSVFALAGFFVIGLILLAWTNRRAHEL